MIKSIKIIFFGVFLCLGYITQAQSPGGVSTNLQLWMKANDGLNIAGNTWTDKSSNGFTATKVGMPTANTMINFNPTVTFGSGNYFTVPHNTVLNQNASNRMLIATVGTSGVVSYNGFFAKTINSSWDDGWQLATNVGGDKIGFCTGDWSGGDPTNAAFTTFTGNKPSISCGYSTGNTGNANRVRVDGKMAAQSNSAVLTQLNTASPVTIGSAGTYVYDGTLAEAIMYNNDVSANTNKIESYLALKYGITLDIAGSPNYVNAAGTPFWTGANNTGYNNNVFGIGRDNGSALLQKQSNSVNSGSQPIIGQGSSLANSNTANANSFTASDTSFVMAGSDNGAASFATSISGISGINNRLTRIWKVQRTNHSDTVVIAWPTTNTTATLLISNDNVFNSSDIAISTTTVVINGTSYQMARVSASQLTNGSFFTFGAFIIAPGAVVTDLQLWLKADDLSRITSSAGNVSQWSNSNTNFVFNTTRTASSAVTHSTSSNLINFNPSINFNGSQGSGTSSLSNTSINVLTGLTTASSTPSSYHFINVGQDETTNLGNLRAVIGNGSSGNNPGMDFQKDDNSPNTINYWTDGGGSGSVTGEWGTTTGCGTAGTTQSNATVYNNAGTGVGCSASATNLPSSFAQQLANRQPQIFGLGFTHNATTANKLNSWTDGYKQQSPLSPGTNSTQMTNPLFYIGNSGGGETWVGKVNEVIVYKAELSDADMRKVNSYLAIKYGITLGQGNNSSGTYNVGGNAANYNYNNSNGINIWTGTTNSGYNSNIFGIGRDNGSTLLQKQSNSVNSGSQPIIGQGSSLANSNIANSNSFTASDMSFVMAGSDNGVATFTTSISGITGINNRLTRIWKVQRTNHSDTVVIAWPTSNTTAMLLVSTDNVFNSSDIAISTTTAVINGRSYQMARVSASQLTDGSFFTFGAYVTMPGGVSGALIWTRADLGTNTTTNLGNVSSWVNNGSGEGTFTTLGTTANPKFTTNFVNFNPAVGYYSTCGGCGLKNAGVNAAGNGGNMLLTSYAVNIRDAWPYGYVPTITFPNATGSFINENYAGLANLDATRWYLYAHGPSANLITVPTQIANKPYISSLNFPAIGQTVYTTQNGTLSNSSSNVTSDYWVGRDANLFAEGRSIGSGAGYHLSYGHMTEVIAFIKTLSSTERNQLESYLAIKYGVTLLNDLGTSTRNYLSPRGSNIWNASVSSSFSNNVFGVGRDDLTALNQRVSNSVNTISAAKLIVASNNNYTWRNDTNARTTFTRDSVYQIYGDNNNNSTTLIDLDTNSCPALKGNSKRIAKKWRVQTTGVQDATWIRADLTSYSNFSSSFMLIADDSNFTINAAIVPTNSYSSGIAVVNYRFPTNSVKFISFGGVPGTPACTQCVGGKGIIKSSSWSGAATANVKLNVNAGNPTSGAITANLRAFTGNTGVEWINSRTPSPYGAWTWLERWDVGTQTVPYTVKLSQAVTADFQVSGINSYWGKSDIVRVIGFCGNTQVVPTVTRDNKSFSTYNLSGNTATGSSCCYEGYSYSTINVSFKNQVDSIRIEWTAQNPPTFKTWSWLYIGDMSLGCANPIEPNPDNMYVTQSFITDTLETCRVAKLKINVKNMNCSSKQISLWNTLPSGIQYLDTTYLDLDALTGSKQPTITSSSFRWDSLTVRSGESNFYINVKSTSNATADYAFQSRYRVVSSGHTGDTILSDDASGQSGLQTTKLRYVASSSISPLPTMVYSADKSCFDNRGDTITYKVTYNNTSGSSIANVDFTNHLSGGQKYVSGSLNKGSLGGTNDLLDTFHIIISNMTLPVGTSTITYKVYTDSVTKRIENNGIIAIDRTSPCGSDNQVNSNILGIDSAFYYSGLTTGSPKASDIGITTLDRNLNSNWPKGLPNAWVTLHSRTKGFVITRTTSTAITTPIEGMLIYDTTDKCMKLYNGTIWKCIERQCAE